MLPRIVRYCELAGMAKIDETLIKNHVDSKIPMVLQRELDELNALKSLCKEKLHDDRDLMASLDADIAAITCALYAYDVHV